MQADAERPAGPTVLAIGVNPGEIEFQCGGVLALLAQRGATVVLASMTPGDKSAPGLPEEVSALRRGEARTAASVIGADYHCLEWREHNVFVGDTACRKATALVRHVAPTWVLTHHPADSRADHAATSAIVQRACTTAAVRGYEAPAFPELDCPPPADSAPSLYFCVPGGGVDALGHRIEPEQYIDVSSTGARVEAMLGAHQSQKKRWDWAGRERMLESAGLRVAGSMAEGVTRYRGGALPTGPLIGAWLRDAAQSR